MGSLEQPKRNFAYSIYVYKKAGQDEQSHHNHIESTHNDASAKADFKKLFPDAPSAMLLDYDSVISIIVPNIGCIEKMRDDPDFLGKFIPDHFNFADMSRSRCVVGWAEHYTF
ncbi:hypothetical protein CMEL01_11593 [Colletotrichum melonis]|uniref:EthD domain-containing protein n=2 Tax=Colletotrichum acutatum species complex TaxID=2707335 RepID=A0AAI9V0T8_9PEZI|nr:uncharacterized protein CTAM01_08174 [Colletotrichum tamarilloi]KAK1465601.1 hypothetical protein CMEL01_11593 [Colletotrichum melonis]KAK1496536.1 hypothetical protein CTAM01_08174 [Colletotrichum tamarilloi]